MKSRFLDDQYEFFKHADARHFFWQTQNQYFARTERELLEGFFTEPNRLILELGCGEGGNLVNLFGGNVAPGREVVGLDLFLGKLIFAKRQFYSGRFICGDAVCLPFRDAVFDAILCRDLLHHLEDREAGIQEIRRVTKPGGNIWIVEPNGKNPLIRLFALLRPHERGQLRNSVESIRELVARYFSRVEIEVRQPFPLYRLVLHYQFGLPRLGFCHAFATAMDAWDRVLRAIFPPRWWAYIIAKVDNLDPL